MSEIKRYTLQEVVDFLNGEGELDGYYFNGFPPRKPYFWRKYLCRAMDDHLAAINQAKIEAVREFAEFVISRNPRSVVSTEVGYRLEHFEQLKENNDE